MTKNDYDSPWKTVLEHYFQECLEFYFPDIATSIDWTKQHKFLDKELQRITKKSQIGRRYADKLVQVCLKSGEDVWVLVHVEVQGSKEPEFAKRMYVYNYRIFDRYDRKVASLGILTDNDPDWRPSCFHNELFGCKASLEFPIVKLLDYQQTLHALTSSRNPFAVVTESQLKSSVLGKADDTTKFDIKMSLVRRLYSIGYNRDQVRDLFAFIDWVITLPEELENKLFANIETIERSGNMKYVTSVERIYEKRGLEKGMVNLISRQLTMLYKIQSESILPLLQGLKPKDLERVGEMIVQNNNQDEILAWIKKTKASDAN